MFVVRQRQRLARRVGIVGYREAGLGAGAVFDDGFCHACECERSLEERIIGAPGEDVD